MEFTACAVHSCMDYAWIYRSILESIVLTLKNNYDNMCNEMNHFAKHIIITGGGSNSDLLCKSLLTCSTFRPNAMPSMAVQVSGLQSTAVGSGLYPSYETTIGKMVRVKDVYAS